jgi:hypothetical protein
MKSAVGMLVQHAGLGQMHNGASNPKAIASRLKTLLLRTQCTLAAGFERLPVGLVWACKERVVVAGEWVEGSC